MVGYGGRRLTFQTRIKGGTYLDSEGEESFYRFKLALALPWERRVVRKVMPQEMF